VGQILRRPPIVVYDDCSLREAADHMVRHDVGRLPVVSRTDPRNMVGIITRSDVLSAYRRRVDDLRREQPRVPLVRGHSAGQS
jgi:predicted transcriptional regulator